MEEGSKADEQNLNNLLHTDDSSSEDSDDSILYGHSIIQMEVPCDNRDKCGLNRTNDELGLTKTEKINFIENSKICQTDLRNPVPNLQVDKITNENYKCPKCNYISNLKHHYEMHLTTHLLIKPFACLFCCYESFYSHDLESHKKEHIEYDIPLKKFNLKLPQNFNLYEDAETNNNGQNRTVSFEYETSIKSALTPPLSYPKNDNLNSKEQIFCYHCEYSTSTNFALKRHYKNNHPSVNHKLLETVITAIDQNGIKVFSCPLCPFACQNIKAWSSHWLVHPRGNKRFSNSVVYNCDRSQCLFKTLSLMSLSKHKKTHHE